MGAKHSGKRWITQNIKEVEENWSLFPASLIFARMLIRVFAGLTRALTRDHYAEAAWFDWKLSRTFYFIFDFFLLFTTFQQKLHNVPRNAVSARGWPEHSVSLSSSWFLCLPFSLSLSATGVGGWGWGELCFRLGPEVLMVITFGFIFSDAHNFLPPRGPLQTPLCLILREFKWVFKKGERRKLP